MASTQKVPASAGSISSFAHLAGALAARADNDTDEEDNKKDRKKDEKEDTEAKKAEDDVSKKKAAEKDEEDEKDKKEAARKKAEKEKDTSDDDEHYDDHKARHAERSRIHAIMTSAGASHAVEEAERLAFHTDMSADLAISNLNVKAMELMLERAQKPAPATKTDSLRDRMQNEPTPQIGADGESVGGDDYQSRVNSTVAATVAAYNKLHGKVAKS